MNPDVHTRLLRSGCKQHLRQIDLLTEKITGHTYSLATGRGSESRKTGQKSWWKNLVHVRSPARPLAAYCKSCLSQVLCPFGKIPCGKRGVRWTRRNKHGS